MKSISFKFYSLIFISFCYSLFSVACQKDKAISPLVRPTEVELSSDKDFKLLINNIEDLMTHIEMKTTESNLNQSLFEKYYIMAVTEKIVKLKE